MLFPGPAARLPIISAAELAVELGSSGRRQPVLLDVRWTLAGSDRDGYLAGHLPGARYSSIWTATWPDRAGLGGRHPLPDPLELQQVWRARGLDDDSVVVVYDGGPGLASARAWWLLRWSGLRQVRVLDGGLPAWTADPGRPVSSGPEPAPEPGIDDRHGRVRCQRSMPTRPPRSPSLRSGSC